MRLDGVILGSEHRLTLPATFGFALTTRSGVIRKAVVLSPSEEAGRVATKLEALAAQIRAEAETEAKNGS